MKQDNKIILYTTDSGNVSVSVQFEDENFWMTQKAIAELFETDRSVITKHLSNIYEEEELDKKSTCAKFAQVQIEGNRKVSRLVEFYAFVQNKLHYAITGKTAAELISERVSLEHPTMGLITWNADPNGKIIKRDVAVAKNYLNEKELSRLNRIEGKGTVSHEDAVKKAESIYEQFRVQQDRDYISQFDIEMSKYLKGEGGKDK